MNSFSLKRIGVCLAGVISKTATAAFLLRRLTFAQWNERNPRQRIVTDQLQRVGSKRKYAVSDSASARNVSKASAINRSPMPLGQRSVQTQVRRILFRRRS